MIQTCDILIDDADRHLLEGCNWYLNDEGYVRTGSRKFGGERFLHRIIMQPKKGEQVDHENLNKLDNRRSNLRIATRQGNSANRTIKRKTNLPRGVSLDKRTGKYTATIRIDNQLKWLGYYNTPEMAALVYDKAAREAFGEFATLNYPLEMSEQ